MQNKVRFPVLALAGYFKAERLVGEACEDLRGREGANGLFFTHSDHLGSSSWTTDADGRAIQHIEYLPFGEELLNQRVTSYSERYTFTGKELDEESNLYYYDARYNSSTYSQFTAVDPMSDKYPSVNPYLYCAGNPIKYVDPTGMQYTVSVDDESKTITITAVYLVKTEKAMEIAKKAVDFWNGQTGFTYSNKDDGIDNYKVVFSLSCVDEIGKDNEAFENDSKQYKDNHTFNCFNAFDDKGYQDSKMGTVRSGCNTICRIDVYLQSLGEHTAEHEMGHSLGMKHTAYGLMVDTNSSLFYNEIVTLKSIRQCIEGGLVNRRHNNSNKKLQHGKVKRNK